MSADQSISDAVQRRYFAVDFGIDYLIVARDENHVVEILREADFDFNEDLAELGGPVIRELERGQSAQVMVWDDSELCNLTEFPMGSCFSSEF